jgi:tetratricopeptide (TPR) repeat protein
VAVDREAILRNAEKLLRQGKIAGAIEEYARLVEAQPRDWNSINALGDLYLRAGNGERAVEHFNRVADYLFQEGFFPKAAALYKKSLKAKADDEHTLLQLGAIAATQGLLADAKLYFRQLAAQRKSRGDERGTLEVLVRLGSLEDADVDSRVAAARAAQQMGDTARAAVLLKDAADALDRQKRPAEALDLLVDAAQLDPADQALRSRLARECVKAGNLDRARPYLDAQSVGSDPDLLFALGQIELAAGRDHQARALFTRLLAVAPERYPDVMRVARERAAGGGLESAFGCVEVIADAALLGGVARPAIEALQAFVADAPGHIPALARLVELCVDEGLDGPLLEAQGRLADAHLEAGNGAEARFIAEDLLYREPGTTAHIERLRRALALLGESDPDQIIAQRLPPDREVLEVSEVAEVPELPEVPELLGVPELLEVPEVSGMLEVLEVLEVPELSGDPEDEPVVLEPVEIDLSHTLVELGLVPSTALPEPKAEGAARPPDLESVFADIRSRVARDKDRSDADAQYDRALEHLRAGRLEDAVADLQAAARAPMLRFAAASQLGRLLIERGELKAGIDWLERAAEAPAPTADDGFALLYDLAAALERMGESARALAILLELDADAGDYRDIRTRIGHLSRVQTGSPRA